MAFNLRKKIRLTRIYEAFFLIEKKSFIYKSQVSFMFKYRSQGVLLRGYNNNFKKKVISSIL